MKKKLTRAEKGELTRKNLFDAAMKVVGQVGYRDTSVNDVTARARVAQGTFYNYFESRQDLLDHLLPELGKDLLEFLGKQVGDATFLEREEKSIQAYFQFIKEKPEFYRILMEAQVDSPQSFDTHAANLVSNYVSALQKTKEKGFLQAYSEEEFEVIALILLGARVYLSRQYCFKNGKATTVPDHVVQTYMKLISGGLQTAGDNNGNSMPKPRQRLRTQTPYDCTVVPAPDGDFAAIYTMSFSLASIAAAEADFYLQQISADFTRRAMEYLLDDGASVGSVMTHLSRHRPAGKMHVSGRVEHTSTTEGVLHVRITDHSAPAVAHIATCTVAFYNSRPV
ncbi:TetR/AcrR family transcriptional regulator [Herbaspirillum sp. GCM10030257]|uniref:TetR/AcrR family transcriptional regulator n=1 Tax=Herbaspirillum sp. GCM10030257 TaxID=3273393 RepID=UPI0036090274